MQLSAYLLLITVATSKIQGVVIKNVSESERILGGTLNENSPKNTAAIFSRNRKHVCSGALIHPSWILTSALCAEKTQQYEMRVIIGETFTNETFDIAYKINKQFIYPGFDYSNLVDDIALLQLDKPVNSYIKVFKIPKENVNLYGKDCIVTGYGYYEPTHIEVLPGYISQRYVRIIKNSFCSQYPITLTNEKLCTVKSACNGDQGAPLITSDTNELIGLVSLREGNIICGFEAIPLTLYTKVVPYKEWIKSTAEIDL